MKHQRSVPVSDESGTSPANEVAASPRQLVYVPILHCPSDMGSAADKLAAAYVERFGRQHWQEFLALIEGFWQAVRAALERLDLDYRLVDLYQDGLPLCGREREIVTKAAATGSQNHQLLLELASRGASLVGTEDPKLLLKEHQDVQAALAGEKPATPAGLEETLSKRDAFIARRIGQTLQPGRTGVLFIGMMHHVETFLPADLVVRRLDVRAPREKSESP